MKEFYEKKINEILSKNKPNVAKKELDKLIEDSNHDHYVIAKTIEFRFKKNFSQSEQMIKLLDELVGDDEYFELITYYYAILDNREGNRDKAIEGLQDILHRNGKYAEKARRMYPGLLYADEDYETVLSFFDYSKENNCMNSETLFYAGKIYYHHHDLDTAREYVEAAVEMNPKEQKYHTFLRALYQDSCDYKNALNEIRILQSMNINPSLRNKLDMIVPVLYNELNFSGKAFVSIKDNIKKGLTNTNQEMLYYKLASQYGDFKTVDQLSDKMKGLSSFCSQHFKPLAMAYQNENLCDKALDLIDSDLVDKSVFEVQLLKANILIQMKKYKEAKVVLERLLSRSSNPLYKVSYALCLFNEGNFDEARKIMEKVPTVDNRLWIYLKYELGILDLSEFKFIPPYAKQLENYDFEAVYRDTRNRLNKDDKPYRVNENVNIKKFIYEMKDIVESLNPSYTFDKDTYLIDYGINVAKLNETPTSFFLVDAIPGGNMITMRPVIPSKDGLKNYQRVR